MRDIKKAIDIVRNPGDYQIVRGHYWSKREVTENKNVIWDNVSSIRKAQVPAWFVWGKTSYVVQFYSTQWNEKRITTIRFMTNIHYFRKK